MAISKARFTSPDPAGPYIPGAIERAISAGATVHELGPLTASIFLRYFGPRPLIEDNSHRSSGATILNAQATYRVAPHVRVALECLNLTDAKVDDIAYWFTSRTTPAGGARDDMHVHPAISRSFRGSMVIDY